MKHLVLLVVVLLGAAASYFMGFESGIVPLVVVGGLFELTFWVLALRRRNP